jgi:hypothetical protein
MYGHGQNITASKTIRFWPAKTFLSRVMVDYEVLGELISVGALAGFLVVEFAYLNLNSRIDMDTHVFLDFFL